MGKWNELLKVIYEASEGNLVRKFDQRTIIGDYEGSGLCYGLCFNWFVQRLQDVERPLPTQDMRRVRFVQAFGNLNAWAAKGHVPTGRAFSSITMPDYERSTLFEKVRKDVVPDRQYVQDVRIYSSDHYHHVSQDVGLARQELGNLDTEWYGEHVILPALESYKSKLKSTSQRYGFLTPVLPGGMACVGHREGTFGGFPTRYNKEQVKELLENRIGSIVNPHNAVLGAFMSLYKSYLADCSLLGNTLKIDPMSTTVCAVIGWMGGKDGAAHAVALSYRGDILGEVRYFDPNMGDFFFPTWTDFKKWHSVVFCGCYTHRQYMRWDLELYTRPLA